MVLCVLFRSIEVITLIHSLNQEKSLEISYRSTRQPDGCGIPVSLVCFKLRHHRRHTSLSTMNDQKLWAQDHQHTALINKSYFKSAHSQQLTYFSLST